MNKKLFFKIIVITILGFFKNSHASTLTHYELDKVEKNAVLFTQSVDLEEWQSKLFNLDKNKYYDMCGEKGLVPSKGFSTYCEFYYTFSFAKEKGFNDGLKNKYKKNEDGLYEISNIENEMFNEFYENYKDDKVQGNDINDFLKSCDSYYKDKNRSNKCIVDLAVKSRNPFNIGIAYCFYQNSTIDALDTAGKYLYRKTNEKKSQECFDKYISENKEYFLKWELYIGYKTGLSLSYYINKNNLYDFTIKTLR